MTVQAVATSTSSSLPSFEGAPVATASVKIQGNGEVDLGSEVISLDDRVRIVGEFRVVGVYFKVDPKTGETVREQVLKPVELETCPWDPNDPTDNGIARARPSHAPLRKVTP